MTSAAVTGLPQVQRVRTAVTMTEKMFNVFGSRIGPGDITDPYAKELMRKGKVKIAIAFQMQMNVAARIIKDEDERMGGGWFDYRRCCGKKDNH